MVALPVPNAVTKKLTVLVPTVIGRDKGTEATLGLLEVNDTLKFVAAGAESVSIMTPLAPVICKGAGVSAMLEPTITVVEARFNPGAVAVMAAMPGAKP